MQAVAIHIKRIGFLAGMGVLALAVCLAAPGCKSSDSSGDTSTDTSMDSMDDAVDVIIDVSDDDGSLDVSDDDGTSPDMVEDPYIDVLEDVVEDASDVLEDGDVVEEEVAPECSVDGDCDDSDPCTEDVCDDGHCTHDAVDADGDGWAAETVDETTCSGTDCDDSDAGIHPDATEVPDDDVDQDCNGYDSMTCFVDADLDGYGDATATVVSIDDDCTDPGESTNNTDCDDTRDTVHPGATETCNGLDDDCNLLIDEGVSTTYYLDSDGDGFGDLLTTTEDCSLPGGYVTNHTDCDDSLASVHPGAEETCDGAIDHNCDGAVDEGCACTSGETKPCGPTEAGGGWLTEGECESGTQRCISGLWEDFCEGAVYPTVEVCNGVDDDCDGTTDEGGAGSSIFYVDDDGDGYGDPGAAIMACSLPEGYSEDDTDCDDADSTVFPGASEVCDGVDNDCDGTTDEGC